MSSSMKSLQLTAVLLSCLAFGLGSNAYAKKVLAPETIPGTEQVDAESLIDIAEEYLNLIMIDARVESDRREGFIEGSISLPDQNTNCDSLAVILPDFSAPVMFYCNGPKCGRSAKSSQIALDCGYTNIFWFRGGIEEWKAKDYPLQH